MVKTDGQRRIVWCLPMVAFLFPLSSFLSYSLCLFLSSLFSYSRSPTPRLVLLSSCPSFLLFSSNCLYPSLLPGLSRSPNPSRSIGTVNRSWNLLLFITPVVLPYDRCCHLPAVADTRHGKIAFSRPPNYLGHRIPG